MLNSMQRSQIHVFLPKIYSSYQAEAHTPCPRLSHLWIGSMTSSLSLISNLLSEQACFVTMLSVQLRAIHRRHSWLLLAMELNDCFWYLSSVQRIDCEVGKGCSQCYKRCLQSHQSQHCSIKDWWCYLATFTRIRYASLHDEDMKLQTLYDSLLYLNNQNLVGMKFWWHEVMQSVERKT